MSKGKIALISVLFALATFVIPFVLLLMFVNAEHISVYITVFLSILALVFGFIIALILSIKKDVLSVLDEIKVQNAAIAFKLSKSEIKVPAEVDAEESLPVLNSEPEKNAVHEKYDDFQ